MEGGSGRTGVAPLCGSKRDSTPTARLTQTQAARPAHVVTRHGDLGHGDLGQGDLGQGDLGQGDLGQGARGAPLADLTLPQDHFPLARPRHAPFSSKHTQHPCHLCPTELLSPSRRKR